MSKKKNTEIKEEKTEKKVEKEVKKEVKKEVPQDEEVLEKLKKENEELTTSV